MELVETHEPEHQARQEHDAKRRRLNPASQDGRDCRTQGLGRVRRAEVLEKNRIVETVHERAEPLEKPAGLALINGEIRPIEASVARQRSIDGMRRALAGGESQENPGRKDRIEKRGRVANQHITIAGHLR
jgi:hypothetical protein